MPDLIPVQVLQMEAGPELDALVAERVMGWKWDETRCRVCGWPLDTDGKYCRPDNCSMRPPPKRRSDSHAHYSSDIAAAWKVFENDHEHSAWIQRMSQTTGPSDCSLKMKDALHRMDYYHVKIGKYGPWVVARTAPLAICRAVLLTTLEVKATSDA